MSDPTRYGRKGGDLEPLKDGQFVAWSDYAALQAENERLREAGDELLKSFKQKESFMRTVYAINAWNAAKEGSDAK